MTARRKSPLEPLVRLREENADRAARDLADATRRSEQALARQAAERARRAAVERDLDETRAREQRELEAGALSVGDLAQAARWGVEETHRRDVARAADEKATGDAEAARVEVDAARGELAHRKADVDAASQLVAKERARAAAKVVAAEEESAEETFAARSRSRA